MLSGMISVLVVFVMIGVGFYFTYRQLWPENANKVFSVAVIQIAAPALVIVNIAEHFTSDLLKASIYNLVIIIFSVGIMFLLGKALSRLFTMTPQKRAVFQVTFTFNNTMFIGFPINFIVFGKAGLPYLFTFYLATVVLFWTMGAYGLAKASESEKNAGFSIKGVLSPGLIAVIIGCLLVELNLSLPTVLEAVLTYLGNLCVPLSLLVIGSNLAISYKKGLPRISADQVLILAGKFVIHPLIIYLLFSTIGVTGLPLQVFILTASLPCHAQTAILSQFYELESEYASNLVSLSTLVSLITIPIYAGILLS